ncbi:hypothetical protein AaE_012913 [Aphanomyces astaci]|uniref:Uncharacterized protein n=1 Tax=Aphanomyces astaci TaxID=112090 RepID=A0A6A4Z9U4_APHAT|nr:hypothetical protein AaE_012913 [Aphanomyces astaci]
MFLHREEGVDMTDDMAAMMKDYVSGYKSDKFAKLKDSGEVPMTEGKAPLSFEGYRYLAQHAISSTTDFSLVATVHPFLVLCWNLMARAVSTSSIRYEHIAWRGDALQIRYGLMKNDQEGRMSFPRHIYASPLRPEICPILSLAILLFTRGPQLPGSPTLLFGYNAKERFSAWLHNTCALHEDDIVAMGLSISDVGTHSFRKGVASTLSNTPGGPQAVSVWLRAGWSLGSVQGRYIFEGSGGDQFVGRAATGLDVNGVEFGSLPPHFGTTVVLSSTQWESILPGYASHYPESFRTAIPFLLASLVFHQKWLKSTLSPKHPLFMSAVWSSGLLPLLVAELHHGNIYCPACGMVASGIPPHVPMYQQLHEVVSTLGAVRTNLIVGFADIPRQITNAIDTSQLVVPPTPLTMDGLRGSLIQFGDSLVRQLSKPQRSLIIPTPTTSVNGPLDIPTPTTMLPHHPRATVTPTTTSVLESMVDPIIPTSNRRPIQSVNCPSGKVYDMWNNFWSGNFETNTPPLRTLRSSDFATKRDRTNHSKVKKVMASIMIFSNLSEHAIAAMSLPDLNKLFEDSYGSLCEQLFDEHDPTLLSRRRATELSYHTIYDAIRKQ